jgi:polyisoprenoid-binding protein YceI
MKRITLFTLLATFIFPLSIFAKGYDITPETTQLTFQVNYLGMIGIVGRFDKFSGNLDWDEEAKEVSRFEGKVESNSVNTSNPDYNKKITDPSILNADKNKNLVLKTLGVDKKNGRYYVNGILHFHGVSNQVLIPLQIVKTGHKNKPKEDYVIFSGKFDINVKKWSVVIDESIYSPTVNVSIQGRAVRHPFF